MKYKTTYYDITFKSNIIALNNWPIKTPALRLSEKAKTDDVVSLATILVDKLEDTNSVEKLVSYGFVSQPLIDSQKSQPAYIKSPKVFKNKVSGL